jgi:hypothetical protein
MPKRSSTAPTAIHFEVSGGGACWLIVRIGEGRASDCIIIVCPCPTTFIYLLWRWHHVYFSVTPPATLFKSRSGLGRSNMAPTICYWGWSLSLVRLGAVWRRTAFKSDINIRWPAIHIVQSDPAIDKYDSTHITYTINCQRINSEIWF